MFLIFLKAFLLENNRDLKKLTLSVKKRLNLKTGIFGKAHRLSSLIIHRF